MCGAYWLLLLLFPQLWFNESLFQGSAHLSPSFLEVSCLPWTFPLPEDQFLFSYFCNKCVLSFPGFACLCSFPLFMLCALGHVIRRGEGRCCVCFLSIPSLSLGFACRRGGIPFGSCCPGVALFFRFHVVPYVWHLSFGFKCVK